MYLLFIKEKKKKKKKKINLESEKKNLNKKILSKILFIIKKSKFNCKGQYAFIYYKKLEKEICILCFFLYLQ